MARAWGRGWLICVVGLVLTLVALSWTQAAHAQGRPSLTANFHTIGLSWPRDVSSRGVAIRYQPFGTSSWRGAQSLWWDGNSPLPAFRRQYRGSIVNLSPDTGYEVSYSLDQGTTWSASQQIRTRSELFAGTATKYSGVRKKKLVISSGGKPSNWRVIDGQNIATIDTDHLDDCVQITASYVILRNFKIQDCRFNAIVIEKPNVVIEGNAIFDWGIQENARDNPSPRKGNVSKKPLSDPASSCVSGVSKGDFGRLLDTGILVRATGNDGIVIQRNTIRDPRYRSTRWVECPGYDNHPYGPRAIQILASDGNLGRGNVIRYNSIYATNTVGGAVTLSDDANRYYDILAVSYQQDLDVYGNIIRNGTDDAIEADNAAVNVRIWGNYINSSLTMISLQLMQAGPAYIFRNIFDRAADNNTGNPGNYYVGIETPYYTSDAPIKIKQNNGGPVSAWHGPAYVYHNTAMRAGNDGFGFGYDIRVESSSKEPNDFYNLISRNNIMMSATNYLYDTHPKNWSAYVFSDMYNRPLNVNTSYTLTEGLNAAAVWKAGHGPSATWTNSPLAPTGRYQVENAGIGLPLANFNDAASRGRGAHQFQADVDAPMTFGVTANWTYRPSE